MKNMKIYKIFAVLLFWMASNLTAQPGEEGLLLLTDRAHYMSGETIYYTAFYQEPEGELSSDWSKIIYVELVVPNGTSLAQHKIEIETYRGSGKVTIPEGISAGTYYLKAYTRWMRNCGPEAFSYTSIQVYDPILESVMPENLDAWASISPDQMMKAPAYGEKGQLECSLEKASYTTREQVEVKLDWSNSESEALITVSVAKAGLLGDQKYFRPGCQPAGAQKDSFLPENKGLTLTGQAVGAEDRSPAAYATIYVSVLGENREFFSNYSDSAGRFYFSFPAYEDNRDLFVSTYHEEYGDLELLIDRDFNVDPLNLPSYPVDLNDTLAELVTEMSINSQISQQYFPPQVLEIHEEAGDGRFFYGHPSATIRFDDIINLPRLEEYFTEVVPQVSVKRTRGEKRFVVLGAHPDLQIYQPLVMIDGVAIFDMEAIFAVSPRLIDRVEIVNAPYVRGNVTFGGIISIVSRNNDLGYIDLPSSGLLVNYQMLDFPMPDTIISYVADSRLPDVRNTLYWNPAIHIQEGTEKKFSFFASDATGDYEILLRGRDEQGNYFSRSIPFRVE